MFFVLVIVLTGQVASTAEAVWPVSSASELSKFLTLLRFRIYADHCSVSVPQLKPQFDRAIEDLNSRIQDISKGLLAADAFKDMKDKPVPAEIIDAFKDSFNDSKHNFERQDAASICPKTLQRLGETDDESLKSGLTDILTAVQTMTRNVEMESRR